MDNVLKKIQNLSTKQKIMMIIVGLIIATLIFIFLYKTFYAEDEDYIITNSSEENQTVENDVTESKIGVLEDKHTITVHVIGEVNTPGVVTLDEGARIIDAINAAGGKTEEADLSKINLAYIIEDGIQIYIPSVTEASETEEDVDKEYLREDAGDGIIITSPTQDVGDEKTTLVNINTANSEKLQTLPGIGESTAQKIIDYREKNGKFQSIEDIKNVSGIGESKFNNIKDKIVV